MRRVLPHLIFALLTLTVFHGFLFQGRTFVTVSILERQLGRPAQEPDWLRSNSPPVRVADNGALLPMLLRIYNDGLHAGEWRLWNPSMFCGYPLTYDTMVHPFYPPHLLLHRLFSWETAYGWTLLLHFFASGVVMFHLLRVIGRSEAAAVLGGLVWMLFGYNALWFSSGILLGVSVFGPLALLAIVRGLERRALPWAGYAGAAFGLAILGSHPQHALLLFLFSLAWIASHHDRAFAIRFGIAFSLLSVGVGLVAVLTRLDSLSNGWRDTSADVLSLYKDWKVSAQLGGLVFGKTLRPQDPQAAYEFAVHAGLAVTALAVAGAVRGWKESLVRFVAVFSVAALLAAFLPPLARLLGLIPLLNSSPPSRWIFVAGVGLAILAARGVDALREGVGPLPWILGGVFLSFLATHAGRLGDGAVIETLAGFAVATAAAFAARKDLRLAGGLTFAAVLIELLPPFYFSHNWPADGSVLKETPLALRPGRGAGLIGATPSEQQGEYYQSELVAGDPLLAFFGVETVGGFEAIIPSHYVRFARAAGALRNPAGRSLTWTRFDSPLLDMVGLRTLYLPPALNPGPRFIPLGTTERLAVYENPKAFPRAWVVESVVTANNDEAERLLTKLDLRHTAILEPGAQSGPLGASGIAVAVGDSIEVDTNGPALMVVSETWDAGVTATVNGAKVPVLRANLAFRAISLPGGKAQVRFAYRPPALTQGLIGSAVFLILALSWPTLRFKRRLNLSAPGAKVQATLKP